MIHTSASFALFLIDGRGAQQSEPEAADLLEDPLELSLVANWPDEYGVAPLMTHGHRCKGETDAVADVLRDQNAVFPNRHAVEDGAPSQCGAVGSPIHMGEL